MPALMQAADVVCVSSRYEGLMRSMIEAMSVGRPVVSTDVASASEMLRIPGREAGVVVPLDYGQEMADAILHLCAHPEEAAKMGQNGAAIARERFNADQVGAAYQRVYDQLTAVPC
jgi:glycosyltransferase involved in cell wall biosynthesis